MVFFAFSAAAAAGTTWCQLAYWEECNRVGRLYPVSASTIEVFSALPKADSGLCLASLYKQNKKPSESYFQAGLDPRMANESWIALTGSLQSRILQPGIPQCRAIFCTTKCVYTYKMQNIDLRSLDCPKSLKNNDFRSLGDAKPGGSMINI